MPDYAIISLEADLVQGKTHAYKKIKVSDDVDLGLFWQRCGGEPAGKMKVTLANPDNDLTVKLAEDDEVRLINVNPPIIAVLIEPTDVDFTGSLRCFPEFKIGDSWLTADRVVLEVIDDPIPDA